DLDGIVQDDFPRRNFLSIDAFVGVVIRANRGTRKRDSGEQTASARVGEHFRAQAYVGIRRGISANGTGRDRGIPSELDLAGENGVGAAVVPDENDEVRGLAAGLKSEAGAFEGHHGRRAPGSAETWAPPAGHPTAAVAGADEKRGLEDR